MIPRIKELRIFIVKGLLFLPICILHIIILQYKFYKIASNLLLFEIPTKKFHLDLQGVAPKVRILPLLLNPQKTCSQGQQSSLCVIVKAYLKMLRCPYIQVKDISPLYCGLAQGVISYLGRDTKRKRSLAASKRGRMV